MDPTTAFMKKRPTHATFQISKRIFHHLGLEVQCPKYKQSISIKTKNEHFFRQSASTKISHQEGKKEKCSQFQTTFLALKSSLRRSPMIVQTFASLYGSPWSKFSKGPVRPTSILSKALVKLCKNCQCRPVFPSKTSK